MSKKAGIRELKNQTSRIVSEVREEMAEYVITSQGNPVAILRPFSEEDAESIRRSEAKEALAEMKGLAEEIGNSWQSPKSALQLLDEDRGSAMAVVDASVYVALINAHEEAHAASWSWLREAHTRGEPIAAPVILVTEVAAAISRGLDEPMLAWRAVQQILSRNVVELVPVASPMAERAADIAIDHRIRGADALYVALAEHRQDELLTLDRQQLERGAAIIPTRRPSDIAN